MQRIFQRISVLLVILALSACATPPPQLVTKTQAPITDYNQLLSSPNGQDVRLGGIIATVKNLKNKTRVEMLSLPVSGSGKPSLTKDAEGRFVIYVNKFLDPLVYESGRFFSVAGTKGNDETETVGEFEYTMPVINAYGYYLWQLEETTYIDRSNYMLDQCYQRGRGRDRGHRHYHGCREFRYAPSKLETRQELR